MFNFIFDGLYDRYHHLLEIVSVQYPFEPIEYLRPPLRITFKEGIDLLREAGEDLAGVTGGAEKVPRLAPPRDYGIGRDR